MMPTPVEINVALRKHIRQKELRCQILIGNSHSLSVITLKLEYTFDLEPCNVVQILSKIR